MYYLTIREPQRGRPVFYVRTKAECATSKMWEISVVWTGEPNPIGGKAVESRRFRKARLAVAWIDKMKRKYQRLSMWWEEAKLTRLRTAASRED